MVPEIRALRKKRHLTQLEAAKEMNISYSFYVKTERGYRLPTSTFIRQFKRVYPGISTDIFFTGGEANEDNSNNQASCC